MPSDVELLAYVQRLINSGKTQIELPADLVANASQEALDEMRRLCKLSGVKIVIRS